MLRSTSTAIWARLIPEVGAVERWVRRAIAGDLVLGQRFAPREERVRVGHVVEERHHPIEAVSEAGGRHDRAGTSRRRKPRKVPGAPRPRPSAGGGTAARAVPGRG